MADVSPQSLLGALLDSWDRNNTILINLFRAIPDDALHLRPMANSPSVAELFAHIHYVRSVFVLEDAPEFSKRLPDEEWLAEPDRERLVQLLNNSAKAVADAVRNKVETTREMNLHYDHPILMLQHMVWHEGYHHGQIKLTLKLAGRGFDDRAIGAVTWGVWFNKTTSSS